MRTTRLVLAAVLATNGLTAKPLEARTIFPAVGGSGNFQWDDHCPPRNFLIGVRGRGGDWLDQVAIVCAPYSNGVRGGSWYGPSRGGGGGTPFEQTCPRDAVVTGAQEILKEKIVRVQRLTLLCTPIGGGPQTTFTVGLDTPPTSEEVYPAPAQNCPGGEVGSGLNGHSGSDVNAIGLDCAVRLQS